ncbi:C-type lectin domain family 4 member K-like [Neodiprion virginianus]|uniref:C-type lectin domain family 4 member K-like n=1 Tax=Neodiprion virginianus TaxID=2961670 RepID=UPI001EE6C545|nr:C-type lectin domain family 4 member K-like [Neodiprion virginianus]
MASLFKSLSLIQIATCLLTVFAVFCCLAEAHTSLASGYTEYTDEKVAYKIHADPKTWLEAKQVCAEEGGSLAFIDTRKKIRFLGSKKSQGVQLWVGISRTSPSTDWSRVDCDDTLYYLPWAPYEPSNSQNCVAIKGCSTGLSSQNCFDRKAFVCEKRV